LKFENVQAGLQEGQRYYDGYSAIGGLNNSFKFKIPVFNNM